MQDCISPRAVLAPSLLSFLASFCLLTISSDGHAAEVDPELTHAEKTLREASIATDGPGLLEFFRKRTLSAAERARLTRALRLLGDDSYIVREKATKDLIATGASALTVLRPALGHANPEIAHRVERCLRAIHADAEVHLAAAAARVLSDRRPDYSVKVLLTYLPSACDQIVEDAVLTALTTLGTRASKADPALGAAVNDKEVVRRVAAAMVLGKGGPEERKVVYPLLNDPEPRVRFHAAAALLGVGDRAGMPTLLKMLSEAPLEFATQAEDLLYRIAGEQPPLPGLEAGKAEQRRRCAAAWEAWLKANEARIDFAGLKLEERLLGITVISEVNSGAERSGRVWACGADGKQRWMIDNVHGPIDVQRLPNGHLLIAEHYGHRVTQRDRLGKIVWQKRVDGYPMGCQRLPNGNTFIVAQNELLEVTPDGKPVFSIKQSGLQDAQKLRDGHILCAGHRNGNIVKLDLTGKEILKISTGSVGVQGVELLPNGHYLATLRQPDKVVEIDSTGKIHWSYAGATPGRATRLRNGNTLVTTFGDRLSVVELNREGKEVWKQVTEGNSWRARRY